MFWCRRGLAPFVFLFFVLHSHAAPRSCLDQLKLSEKTEEDLRPLLGVDVENISPIDARRIYRVALRKEIFESKEISEIKTEGLVDLEPGEPLPPSALTVLRSRIDQLLRLGLVAEDNYNRKQARLVDDFGRWLHEEENIIFSPDNVALWIREKVTYERLISHITHIYDWEAKSRPRSVAERLRHNTSNPFLRDLIRRAHGMSKFLGAFTLGASMAGIGMAFTGFFMTFTGMDNFNKYHQAEAAYSVAESQTTLIVELMQAHNRSQMNDRLAALQDLKTKSAKINDESLRILDSFKGLSAENAVKAAKALDDYFAKHRFHTDRFFSKNFSEGRTNFAWFQVIAPAEWLLRINAAYTPYTLKLDTLKSLERELRYAEEELRLAIREGGDPEFLQDDIAGLKKRIVEVETQVAFFRKQAATVLALWKINELVYAELLVKGPGEMGRGDFYQKAIQEVGYEFYFTEFRDLFLKSAESLGFYFEKGEIEGQFKENIELMFAK